MAHDSSPTRPDDPVGLCAHCRHGHRVETPRATYWRCAKSATDPAFEKYPRLPVRSCPGHEAPPA